MYAYRILMFLLILNLSAMLANSVVTTWQMPTRELSSDISWEALKSWSPINLFIVGDIFTGFVNFVKLIAWVAAGFPIMLANLGVPSEVSIILTTLYGVVMMVALVQFISGRGVED